jgi:phenylpropionate dioxygenase-like ring-hydroxylating dioxygenase large terminal subunit
MITQEENDLLTRVGPGMPAGELLRRYWQPLALTEELPEGAAPLPVRLLGEDLVLFRDHQGRPGLLGLHCSHRGADLSYGRLEDGGLRCIYHGWLYDIRGRCLDQPGEPGGGEHRAEIRHPAYPCEERGGVIFAYMGPGEPPLLPNYEFLNVPPENRFVSKYFQDCNYLQGNEGNLDPTHNNLLHYPNNNLEHTGNKDLTAFRGGRGAAPEMQNLDAEPVRFGVRLCDTTAMEGGKKNLRIYHFVMPNFTMFPGPQQGRGGYSINWHVPIDDHRHWKYTFLFNRERPLDMEMARERLGVGITADYRLLQSKERRYMQDRAAMKSRSYTGIDGFAAQDSCAIEGMGAIQDRTQEHLVSSDRIIVAMRKVFSKAIRDVQQGQDPPNVIRSAEANRYPDLFIYVGVVPESTDWRKFCKQLEAEARA